MKYTLLIYLSVCLLYSLHRSNLKAPSKSLSTDMKFLTAANGISSDGKVSQTYINGNLLYQVCLSKTLSYFPSANLPTYLRRIRR
jgi:hypothetical protein